ncbi:oligopeptide/dipeptide ABC transporter ATP-binding protein [Rhizobium yanglingense]
MSQRVMIAMALACNPKLLIADEPTTALDVTIQAQILDLLVRLQKEQGMALVLITHDMGVVAETAERVQVQYAGQKVEEQPVKALFRDPHHPYTAALLAALPGRVPKSASICRRSPVSFPASMTARRGCLFAPRCGYATVECDRGVVRQGPELGLCAMQLSFERRQAARSSRRDRRSNPLETSYDRRRSRGQGSCPLLHCQSRHVQTGGDRQGAERRELQSASRQDARRCRRIRLRQVDARAPGHA